MGNCRQHGSAQVYGLRDQHGVVYDALELDRSWYEAPTIRQNTRLSITPPLNMSYKTEIIGNAWWRGPVLRCAPSTQLLAGSR